MIGSRVACAMLLCLFITAPGWSQGTVTPALDATERATRAARESQQRIDRLDDQTRAMLERYRSASWQAQQLTVYADQLEALVAAQGDEKASLERQIQDMERTERELLPLMQRMVEGLETFIELDLPFLATERGERLASLQRLMADPEANNADKFGRILEAWQIEAEYGRSLGAERIDVDGRSVEMLRVGRTGLYYLSTDGREAGIWNPDPGRWETLPSRHISAIRHGLRMARDSVAPDLLRLPVITRTASDTR